jgi:arsenate reductase
MPERPYHPGYPAPAVPLSPFSERDRPKGAANRTTEVELSASAIGPDDFPAARNLLRQAGLPADDLGETGVALFSFRDPAGRVGLGGLELYGAEALLRSVVVVPGHRGSGVGSRIVGWLLDHAARAGARRVYLLTADAGDFFRKAGFTVIERSAAPPSIASIRQMTGLCPSSAFLMMKQVHL